MDTVLGHNQPFPAAVRKRVLERQNYACYYCGTNLKRTRGHRQVHIDHRTPPSQGGTNDESNLVAACQTCNLRKNHRSIAQYRRYIISRSLVWWTALIVGKLVIEYPEIRRLSVGRLLTWSAGYAGRFRFPGEVAELLQARGSDALTQDPRSQAAMPPTQLTLIDLDELKQGRS